MTWDQIVAFAPELASVDVEVQTIVLTAADDLDPESFTTGTFPLAQIWYAAHLATQAAGGDSPGAIASESGGGLAVSYAASAQSTSPFASTSYGRRYLALLLASPGAVVCDVISGD